jgi:hypothetical protein
VSLAVDAELRAGHAFAAREASKVGPRGLLSLTSRTQLGGFALLLI